MTVQYDQGDPSSASKLFAVPDFIGFACREVASRIRGAVASVPFEVFHKYSTDIIRAGVFGKDADGNVKKSITFSANNLVSASQGKAILIGLYVHNTCTFTSGFT